MVQKEELRKIVGSEDVLDGRQVLEQYSRDMSLVHPIRPTCVVRPANTDEVQAIVRWANDTLTPLVPVSSGAPHFRGDTVPSAGGAVIVDLSHMKRVVRVDRFNRVAMIEPGVTFSELRPRLADQGMRMNVPLLPRSSKSVVGSMLEREPVMMPKYHWDAPDPLACTELVFGTGDLFRTGSAAGPGSLEEQIAAGGAQKEGPGPANVDFYRLIGGAQGTVGIVTWATLRCELLPRVSEPFLVTSASLDRLFEFIHWILRLRLVDECFVLNNTNLAKIMKKEASDHYEFLRDRLPDWLLFFCISGYEYFPEEKVAYRTEDMLRVASQVGVEPLKAAGNLSAHRILKLIHKPSEEPYWKIRDEGGSHDIFFLATYNRLSALVDIMKNASAHYGYSARDMGIYLQPIVQGTSCHCEFNLFYDPSKQNEVDRVRDLSNSAVEILMDEGAFFSRPYGVWADMTFRRDSETTSALRKVKSIFDPKGIMNPGKLCF